VRGGRPDSPNSGKGGRERGREEGKEGGRGEGGRGRGGRKGEGRRVRDQYRIEISHCHICAGILLRPLWNKINDIHRFICMCSHIYMYVHIHIFMYAYIYTCTSCWLVWNAFMLCRQMNVYI